MNIVIEERTILDATIDIIRPIEKRIPDDLWEAISEVHTTWDRIGQTFYFYDITSYNLDTVAKLLLAYEEAYTEQCEKHFDDYLEKFLTGQVN